MFQILSQSSLQSYEIGTIILGIIFNEEIESQGN